MTAALAALAGGLAALALAARRRWLTRGGLAAALAVGAGVWAGTGPAGLALLLAFFTSSAFLGERPSSPGTDPSAAGPPPRGPRPGAARSRVPRETRTGGQVLANGGLAAAAGALAATGLLPEVAGNVAVVGALAAATSDTWASEVGARLRGTTRLLGLGRRVPPGTPGGVSTAGTLAALAGGLLLGALAWGLGIEGCGVPGRAAGSTVAGLGIIPGIGWAVVGLLGGLAGTAADSAAGAALGRRVEEGRGRLHDLVNLLGTLVGAGAALSACSALPGGSL